MDREKLKIDKYKRIFSSEQMRFVVPSFVMESAGNVGTLALNFMEKLSREFMINSDISLKKEVLVALQILLLGVLLSV